ncbi:hypothetical protein GCM10009828_081140 [Actinoplanes couchii]|uniref:DUF4407 domain-containing protein n=2 Tax=Actinoplanes couchii TaxID=403638 RepID=A0ABQ3XKD4_9ACTN|nr:hypothetical protein Aco03nite_073630 [Actinoplanes couchii]
MRTGPFLASLGGADPDVLARAKQISKAGAAKDQARFVALGLVLLATAALAMVSMTFAMTDGLHIGPVGAVLVGVFWGLIILIVDRALILSLKPKGSRWLLFWMILPRVLMAALLGLVVSTPLTLRIFADEIGRQMSLDNIVAAEQSSIALSTGDRQKRLKDLDTEIAKYEGYLRGDVPVTSPELVAAENEYKQADTAYQTKQAAADKAWAAWKCELDGKLCDAGSGKPGNGDRAQALRREYDHKADSANAARTLAQRKQAALTRAQAQAKNATGDKVTQAQDSADQALPALRQQRDVLRAAIQDDQQTANQEAAGNTGLLAQLVALSHLGEDNGWARAAHLLVAALLFMLELLPVAVKSLSILGPPTAYDQIDDLDTKEVVRAAGRQEYIDKDLENRKKRIVAEVHNEVEVVMREIAKDQIESWKQKVKQVIANPPPPGATAPAAGNRPRPSAASRVARGLNLPPSKRNL